MRTCRQALRRSLCTLALWWLILLFQAPPVNDCRIHAVPSPRLCAALFAPAEPFRNSPTPSERWAIFSGPSCPDFGQYVRRVVSNGNVHGDRSSSLPVVAYTNASTARRRGTRVVVSLRRGERYFPAARGRALLRKAVFTCNSRPLRCRMNYNNLGIEFA